MRVVFGVFVDVLTFFWLSLRPPSALAAENLFLRKQLYVLVIMEIGTRRIIHL